jgi:hypothetical protein
MKITAIIHRTDAVACSKNPISIRIDDVNGVIGLSTALGRAMPYSHGRS